MIGPLTAHMDRRIWTGGRGKEPHEKKAVPGARTQDLRVIRERELPAEPSSTFTIMLLPQTLILNLHGFLIFQNKNSQPKHAHTYFRTTQT